MSDDMNPVCRLDDAPEVTESHAGWASTYKVLTPNMRKRGGSLGVCHMRIPPGHAAVPFHYHLREDEAFYVLAGRGVLRYGEDLIDIGPGDCIACPTIRTRYAAIRTAARSSSGARERSAT